MELNKSQGMDLDSLLNMDVALVTTNVNVLFDANGDAKSGFVIVGKNSPQYQAISSDIRVSNITRSAARKKAIDTSTEDGAKLLTSTLDANELTTAKAVVVGWFGFDIEGSPATFDPGVVEKMLTKFPTWRQRIISELDNDANFIKV